jgi:hypothetical protein
MPSLFPRFVDSVQTDEASFILEHERGQLERDAMMFPPV